MATLDLALPRRLQRLVVMERTNHFLPKKSKWLLLQEAVHIFTCTLGCLVKSGRLHTTGPESESLDKLTPQVISHQVLTLQPKHIKQATNPVLEVEDGNEMSRSSSVSTKDRTTQNKRAKAPKQRRDDSESFDSRSQYTPFFPQPQVPTWMPAPQYPTMVPQQFGPGIVPNSYQSPQPNPYAPPTQQYNQPMMSNANMQPYNTMPQVKS